MICEIPKAIWGYDRGYLMLEGVNIDFTLGPSAKLF